MTLSIDTAFDSIYVLMPSDCEPTIRHLLPGGLDVRRDSAGSPPDFVLRVPESERRFGIFSDRAGVVLVRERTKKELLEGVVGVLASAVAPTKGPSLLVRSVTLADGDIVAGPYAHLVGLSFAARQLHARRAVVNHSIAIDVDDIGSSRPGRGVKGFVYLGDEFDAPPTTMRAVFEMASCARVVPDRQDLLNRLVHAVKGGLEVNVLRDQKPGSIASTLAA